jgi:thiosulfate reductase cytochrome b subunit
MERQTHSQHTRIAHWLNALLVLSLLLTGFSIYGSQHHLAWLAMGFSRHGRFTFHELAGAIFAVNGVLYTYELFARGGLRRIVRGLPERFGPLSYELPQRMSYLAVFAGAVAMMLTGAALWFKHQAPWLMAVLGGERVVLAVHLTVAFALLLFIAAHVVQVARAGWPALRSMTFALVRPPRNFERTGTRT